MTFLEKNWYNQANKTRKERRAKYNVFLKYNYCSDIARHERDIHTTQLLRRWKDKKALCFELALTLNLR